jgi:hypothetical protein
MNLSGMVMHYALRIFICKSGVSGFSPKNNKYRRKEKMRFSFAVDGSAGNTTDFFISTAGDARWGQDITCFCFYEKKWNPQNCISNEIGQTFHKELMATRHNDK